jgi:opacity protein-like surface antigen
MPSLPPRPIDAAVGLPRSTRRIAATWILGAAALLAVAAPPARAQMSGDGFLFHQPRASLTLRGGWDGAAAKGDIFSFATRELSLGRNDFSAPFIGLDLAIPIRPRLDLTLSSSFSGANEKSDFRHLAEGPDNLPIEQTTSFTRVPLSAGVRAYLMPRGRAVGEFVWIPARFSPYVGAGAGFMWYRFRQQGDFVDFNTLDIFPDVFTSSGWAPLAQASVGADYSLTPHLALNGEAKYNWAKGKLGTDFSGFDRIDLSGYSATLGLSVRF